MKVKFIGNHSHNRIGDYAQIKYPNFHQVDLIPGQSVGQSVEINVDGPSDMQRMNVVFIGAIIIYFCIKSFVFVFVDRIN
uniref:Uncharacterized protein n=1 Tax=Romanomermis culicivorax TaxID=13658 RepID=A0A915KUV8_ROMCU